MKKLDTTIDLLIKNYASLQDILTNAKLVSDTVKANGGTPYVVGGAVRDKILGKEPKDYDIEVYGLPEEKIVQILSEAGLPVKTAGKDFKVILAGKGKDAIDVTLPARAIPKGDSFETVSDSSLDPTEAVQRRDFTFNAMLADFDALQNIDSYESALKAKQQGLLIDPTNGLQSLKEGKVEHVNDSVFLVDPLRILRSAQFSSRFEFDVDEVTKQLMTNPVLREKVEKLDRNKVEEEFVKLILKGQDVIKGFKILKDLGILNLIIPELDKLPEAKFNKNLFLMNKAKKGLISSPSKKFNYPKFVAILIDGARTPEILLKRFMNTNLDRDQVLAIQKTIPQLKNVYDKYLDDSSDIDLRAALRRIQISISKTKLEIPDILEVAAFLNPDVFNSKTLVKLNESYEASKSSIKPLFEGRDLIQKGLKPGPQFKEILKQLHEMQLDEVFNSKEEGQKFLDEIVEKL